MMPKRDVDLLLVYGNAWQSDYLRYATIMEFWKAKGSPSCGATVRHALSRQSARSRSRANRGPGSRSCTPSMLADVEACCSNAPQSAASASAPKRLAAAPAGGARRRSRICRPNAMLDRLLMQKLDIEIAAIRAAESPTEGYAVFRTRRARGRADYELVAEVEGFLPRAGVDDNFMIIGVGGREGPRHGAAHGQAPQAGRSGHHRADALRQRLLHPDLPHTGDRRGQRRAARTRFASIIDAWKPACAAVKPGVTAADIARAENELSARMISASMSPSAYTRVRGHGLGLFVDTKPHILEDVNVRIDAGDDHDRASEHLSSGGGLHGARRFPDRYA
jgi:hypothetical protein